MSNFKQHEFYIWVIGLLLFYGYLGLIIPLHGIDWFFGSHQGISTFYHHFDNLNGRYISNLIELVAVRSVILRMIMYSIISVSIILLILKLIRQTFSIRHLMLATMLLLIIPNSVFSESYGSFGYFFSYAFGMICVLYNLYFISQILFIKDELKMYNVILFWISCFSGQLFAESLTFFVNLALFTTLMAYFVLKRKINFNLLIGFLLSLCGTLIMLINQTYINYLSDIQAMRAHIDGLGYVHKLRVTILNDLPRYMFFNHIIIVSMIAIVIIGLLIKNTRFQTFSKIRQMILMIGILVLPIYKIFIFEPFNFNQTTLITSYGLINFLLCFSFFVSISMASFIIVTDSYYRIILIVAFISIILSAIPIFFISEVTSQQFFIVYIMWCVILITLVTELHTLKQSYDNILKICVGCLLFVFIAIFTIVHFKYEARLNNIQTQIQQHRNEIIVKHLPFETYFYEMTPTEEIEKENFKEYYQISNNKQLKILPFDINVIEDRGD